MQLYGSGKIYFLIAINGLLTGVIIHYDQSSEPTLREGLSDGIILIFYSGFIVFVAIYLMAALIGRKLTRHEDIWFYVLIGMTSITIFAFFNSSITLWPF